MRLTFEHEPEDGEVYVRWERARNGVCYVDSARNPFLRYAVCIETGKCIGFVVECVNEMEWAEGEFAKTQEAPDG
jgi:hypothetical protein